MSICEFVSTKAKRGLKAEVEERNAKPYTGWGEGKRAGGEKNGEDEKRKTWLSTCAPLYPS